MRLQRRDALKNHVELPPPERGRRPPPPPEEVVQVADGPRSRRSFFAAQTDAELKLPMQSWNLIGNGPGGAGAGGQHRSVFNRSGDDF